MPEDIVAKLSRQITTLENESLEYYFDDDLNPVIIKSCLKCGTDMQLSYKKRINRYCSTRCSNIGRFQSKETRRKRSESMKGKGLGRKLSKEHIEKMRIALTGRNHTAETKRKISKALKGKYTGENHWSWIGDRRLLKQTFTDTIRKSNKYVDWRTDIFERDGYCCQICHDRSGLGHSIRVVAHHIKSFNDILIENKINNYNDAMNCSELWDNENAMTLCESCHMWVHRLNPLDFQ